MDTNILNTIFLSNTTFNFSDFADFSTLLEMLTYDSFKSAQNVFCYRTKIFIFVKSFLKNCYIEFTCNIEKISVWPTFNWFNSTKNEYLIVNISSIIFTDIIGFWKIEFFLWIQRMFSKFITSFVIIYNVNSMSLIS